MSTEKPQNKKENQSFGAINEAFNSELSDQLKKQLKKILDGFRQDLKEHPYVKKLERHEVSKKRLVLPNFRNLFRPFLLAGAGLVCVATLAFFFMGNNPPTWAEVSERLDSVSNLSIVIYYKEYNYKGGYAFSEPKKVEFWLGYGDRIRILSGGKVTFAKINNNVKTFDLETRSQCYPPGSGKMCYHYDAFSILEKIKNRKDIPIAMTIDRLSESGKFDTISQININSEISKDLVVFYGESRDWRVRIWALRESKLPIRISSWSPMVVMAYDMIITYPKEGQPEEFFDPDAFEAVLKDTSKSQFELMYMFFREPGKKPVPSTEN